MSPFRKRQIAFLTGRGFRHLTIIVETASLTDMMRALQFTAILALDICRGCKRVM